ncbi:hypothetical protein [Psychroserpens sp.]|uniref:hypothetical protein n=1 Tax=Psychroserpens sp. TaxID=2020870 RepID=UPI002B276EF6|nr:hypothetical protein [Psychroserpens sp.]
MKTIKRTAVLVWLLVITPFLLIAQEQKPMDGYEVTDDDYKIQANNMDQVYIKLVQEAKLEQKTNSNLKCPTDQFTSMADDVLKSVIKKVKRNQLTFIKPTDYATEFAVPKYMLSNEFEKYKGDFKTISDKALNAFSNTNNYGDFVLETTGKDVGSFTKKENLSLNIFYSLLKKTTTSEKILNDGFFTSTVELSGNCRIEWEPRAKIIKFEYPNITTELKIKVYTSCDCSKKKGNNEIKSGYLEYVATTKGIYTASTVTFGELINPKIKITSMECCPEEVKMEEEPTKTALDEDEGINDLMPAQTIGFGAGAGFSQDFDETTFCVSAEYLYLLNSSEYKGWYVGAEVSHQNTSFGDFKSNKTMAGGKLQYNISGIPSGETQFVAGIMANYAFGSNENNGFNDDFTGTVFCAYGGVNIRVSENWSVGAQFPFLIFENYTFKPEGGGEFKTDATSLFINKDNPLKIIIRRRL